MKKKYIEALQMQVNKTNSSSAVKAVSEKSASRGFTLVELVVVIAVLGILAGIAIPRFMKSSEAARGARILGDLRTVDSAIMVYQARNGVMPTEWEQIVPTNPDENNSVYLAARPVPPSGTFSVVQNDGATKEHEYSAATYEIKDGRAVYTSGDITDGTVDDYLRGIGDGFADYVQQWLAAHNGTGLTTGEAKNKLYAEYYANHSAIAMSDEEKQKYNQAGLEKSLLDAVFYWWTYPVTDKYGNLLYTVTYANARSNPNDWTGSGRREMGKGYIVQVNGKTYMRTDNGASVYPGDASQNYKTTAELETALIKNGYIVVK